MGSDKSAQGNALGSGRANAIGEWARQRTLTPVLDSPARSRSEPRPGGDASGSGSGSASASAGGRIETTQEEIAAYEVIRRLLGPARPVAYEDTVSDFKIHLAERTTWVMCRMDLGRERPSAWVPLPLDQVQALSPALMPGTPQEGWTCITLNASGEIEQLGDVLRAAWDAQKAIRTRRAENADGDVGGLDGSVAGAETAAEVANGHEDPAKPSGEPNCEEYR